MQNPLGAWLGFGTQPCYEVPGDLWVELSQNAVVSEAALSTVVHSWPWGSQIVKKI